MAGRVMNTGLRRNMLFGGHGRLTGEVVRARVSGDPAGSGDLFLERQRVLLMALPEKIITAEQITDRAGAVTFDHVREGHEFAAFIPAVPLPDASYVIGDWWDRLFPSPMP